METGADAASPTTSALQPPVVLWDGECGFCRKWVTHWKSRVDDRIRFVEFQNASDDSLQSFQIDRIELQQAMHFIDAAGHVHRGAAAVFQLLRGAPEARYLFWADAYRYVPGFADVADGVYRKLAEHRVWAAKATRVFWGEPHRQTFRFARAAFLRLLAIASFLAFWSMWRQVDGLLGSSGILPAAEYLDAVRNHLGVRSELPLDGWLRFPTLFWLDASDVALERLCIAGMVLSGLLFAGVVPRLVIPLLWVGYLSLCVVGQVFLGYQWDALLLETLFISWFVAPWQLLPGRDRRVPAAGRWLVWLLAFKLMFLSGWVKVAADEAWRSLNALDYHFWTQPIPNALAWYADKLPDFVKSAGVLFTLVAELGAPVLIFFPRRLRHAGAITMIALQLAIIATGTYGFFNVLSIALCVMLLDDNWIRWLSRDRWKHTPPRPRSSVWLLPGFICVVVVGTLVIRPLWVGTVAERDSLHEAIDRHLGPVRTFNGYGLFARMTRTRPEIIVQGSRDGDEWFTYDYRYKPTDVEEPLRATTFHMPRLDWQMWFAALGRCENNRWFHAHLVELLRGNDRVEALLEDHDVDAPPPRYIRTRLYNYSFGEETTWRREFVGHYCPVVELDPAGTGLAASDDDELY